jgi:glucosamine--fructose-6-phosphate aminotransferase (isomerizing)
MPNAPSPNLVAGHMLYYRRKNVLTRDNRGGNDMCGIVGYAGKRGAAEVVFEGLTVLEYRGYDSAGISTLCGGEIFTFKRGGRVEGLRNFLPALVGNYGIGHTRWATHGIPSDNNAHPHTAGKFSVVHNGIIENFAELKAELQSAGVRFLSDTDSEVVVHLLNMYYDGDLLRAVKRAVERLKGSFALAILCKDFDGVCAVKYKSPVIIGYGDGENFLASDVPALSLKAGRIAVLNDGDIAYVTCDEVKVYDSNLNLTEPVICEVHAEEHNMKLFGCPHYMLKEIRENAYVLGNAAEAFLTARLDTLKEYLSLTDKIILLGCGTAYNAALAAKYWLEATCSLPCFACVASEVRYFPPKACDKTLLVAVSQSGETADTVEAASLLKKLGARVVAITNVEYSAITRVADIVIPMRAGCEICVAATKSYISQLACLYLFRGLAAGEEGFGEKKLLSAKSAVQTAVGEEEKAEEIAKLCAKSKAVFFLGRGSDYAAAVEGSLKLKEVSYVFSDAYPAGELKHGTLALVDDKTLSIVIICVPSVFEKCLNAVEQILSRGGKVAVITNMPSVADKLKDKAECVALIADAGELSVLPCAVLLQLIAYKTAVNLKHNPDRPRNLAKSVTVE